MAFNSKPIIASRNIQRASTDGGQVKFPGAATKCQNPYPGESSLNQFTVGSPPPSPLTTMRLNIDRCIIKSNRDSVRKAREAYLINRGL